MHRFPRVAALRSRHNAALQSTTRTDSACSVASGRGVARAFRPFGNGRSDRYVGTLGKAVGSFGAFVAGDAELVETLVQRARTYIYTTALPVAVAGRDARGGLRYRFRSPGVVSGSLALTRRFRALAGAQALPLADSMTPIQPILLGPPTPRSRRAAGFSSADILVAAIRPPTVPAGTSRLRVALSAAHRDSDVEGLVTSLAEILKPE